MRMLALHVLVPWVSLSCCQTRARRRSLLLAFYTVPVSEQSIKMRFTHAYTNTFTLLSFSVVRFVYPGRFNTLCRRMSSYMILQRAVAAAMVKLPFESCMMSCNSFASVTPCCGSCGVPPCHIQHSYTQARFRRDDCARTLPSSSNRSWHLCVTSSTGCMNDVMFPP